MFISSRKNLSGAAGWLKDCPAHQPGTRRPGLLSYILLVCYNEIMTDSVKKWSANQEKFIDWLTYGKYERVPATQEALAKELGLHEVTLSRWKRLPGFWDEVKNRVRSRLDEHYADVYGALLTEAKKGSFQHINKYIELMGDIKPQGTQDNPIHSETILRVVHDR